MKEGGERDREDEGGRRREERMKEGGEMDIR